MFYCDPCGQANLWPIIPFGGSYGPCEMCGTVTGCNDVPSSHLPPAGPSADEQVAIASIQAAIRVRNEDTHAESS